MDVVVLYSGGKDSNFSLWYTLHQGWRVRGLVVVESENPDSYMFHHPNIRWTHLQSSALEIPLFTIYTRGEREREVEDLTQGLATVKDRWRFTGIVSGAICSEYQKNRIDRVGEELGVASYTPLWRKHPLSVLREEVELGFEIMIVACSARGMDESWLGKHLTIPDIAAIEALERRYGVNPSFEGGEAETFIIDGPTFKQRITVVEAYKRWRGDQGVFEIKDAKLTPKPKP